MVQPKGKPWKVWQDAVAPGLSEPHLARALGGTSCGPHSGFTPNERKEKHLHTWYAHGHERKLLLRKFALPQGCIGLC